MKRSKGKRPTLIQSQRELLPKERLLYKMMEKRMKDVLSGDRKEPFDPEERHRFTEYLRASAGFYEGEDPARVSVKLDRLLKLLENDRQDG